MREFADAFSDIMLAVVSFMLAILIGLLLLVLVVASMEGCP